MGCFSSKCQVCGEGVNSTSYEGERVHIWLLKGGKVLEHMEGSYDSYGCVFIDEEGVDPKDRESAEWNMDWGDCCDLEFNNYSNDGFAYIHSACWDGTVPTKQSEMDPDQGWNPLKPEHMGERYVG